MFEERCSTCRYLFTLKELARGKWLYSKCCAVFPVNEPDDERSFVILVKYPEKDRCEMYTPRGSLKSKEEDTGVFDE